MIPKELLWASGLLAPGIVGASLLYAYDKRSGHGIFDETNLRNLNKSAEVTSDTSIQILEYDLSPMKGSLGWERLFDSFLERGATLDVFVQNLHPASRDLIIKLDDVNSDKFNLWDYSDISLSRYADFHLSGNDLKVPLTEWLESHNHVTLFENPSQLWIEYEHRQTKRGGVIDEYRYHSDPEKYSSQFKFYSELLAIIKQHSVPLFLD